MSSEADQVLPIASQLQTHPLACFVILEEDAISPLPAGLLLVSAIGRCCRDIARLEGEEERTFLPLPVSVYSRGGHAEVPAESALPPSQISQSQPCSPRPPPPLTC